MTTWRYYVAVLATLAVLGLGWVGWEQHRQTEEQVDQTCIASAAARNEVEIAGIVPVIGAGKLTGSALKDWDIANLEMDKRVLSCGIKLVRPFPRK